VAVAVFNGELGLDITGVEKGSHVQSNRSEKEQR
jgi:hypothetical protein